jgi:hypothetical protein
MSDDVEASLTHLAETLERGQRALRRMIMVGAGGLLSLGLLDALFAGTRPGDHFRLVNLVIIGGLTVMGLLGFSGATQTYRIIVKTDEELLKQMRQNADLVGELNGVRPLLAAIEEAHSHGQPLLVMPPDADEGQPAPPIDPPAHYLN